jgi:acyl-CoA dehydrogenase
MDFTYSPKVVDLQQRMHAFFDQHIYPNEHRFAQDVEANTLAGKRWTPTSIIEELKPKAKAAGLGICSCCTRAWVPG